MNRLEALAEQIEHQSQPPVHLWKPKHIGKIDIRIDAQGFWYHEGDAIQREKLVKLFASILWYENGEYYLVTPVEKLVIEVEDTPYIIHQMEMINDHWVAVTNTHESIIIGEDHAVQLRRYQQQLIPYINVRYDLWARVNRSIYYQWVSEAMQDQDESTDELILQSGDYKFEVARTQS